MIAIPVLITIFFLYLMFRPLEQCNGQFPLELVEAFFRLLYIIPICINWIIYLSILLAMK